MNEFSTEPSKWHLKNVNGRQTWHYDESYPQNLVDKYWLGILTERECENLPEAKNALDAARNGYKFYEKLQTEDGHWAGEYGGPLFLLPGLVITCYVTQTKLKEAQRLEMIRYLRNTQRADGSWGLHIAGEGTMLGSCLNYVSARILGVSASDPMCVKGREFILAHGGAEYTASWGKFWLAVLNVYEWDGMNPLSPELWIIPDFIPFHPSKMWCHCRQIYLPMSYVYGHRIKAEPDELITQLRLELYPEGHDKIDWIAARDKLADIDCYAPHHWLLNYGNMALSLYEMFPISWIRNLSLKKVLEHVEAEDRNSNFIGIGPISKMINMLVMWHANGSECDKFKKHVERMDDYLWLGPDGMRMQGTNGSQLWDTALAIQGVLESGLAKEEEFSGSVKKVLEFLDNTQIKENTQDYLKYYRQPSKGAFPFSTKDCGWIVSDCAAEGLKAVMLLQNLDNMPAPISDERIFDGIDTLLVMQNEDGGFASYEKRRGPFWLEYLNPAEVFGEIMVDYSYTECSSAVVQVMTCFKKFYPSYLQEEVNLCISRAIEFIKQQQREDGSWFGSWAICFTYATWFGLEALACVGENYQNSDRVRKACQFLKDKQLPDGGWGESYKACFKKTYISLEESQVVNTSWACLALMAAGYPETDVIQRGINLIMSRQKAWGEWKQEEIEGVFNKTCMISYPNYKFIFPIWALGRFGKRYEQEA